MIKIRKYNNTKKHYINNNKNKHLLALKIVLSKVKEVKKKETIM